MPLSTIFQLYRGGQFDKWVGGGGTVEYPEKITFLQQVTDTHYHMYTSSWPGFELTDCIVEIQLRYDYTQDTPFILLHILYDLLQFSKFSKTLNITFDYL
jgi:hypothetical protein